MKIWRWISAACFLSNLPVLAQANANCPMHPQTLQAMRRCYRPLLVFSPAAADARLKRQQSALDSDADDMMDRFVLLTPFVEDRRGYSAPLDAPYAVLSPAEERLVRKRFAIGRNDFAVILLGEDGTEKLRSSRPVTTDRLNALIDTMPSRKIERQRKDSY